MNKKGQNKMKRIIIVEDDKTLSQELQLLLNSSGYKAIEIPPGNEIITRIVQVKPDLVLLDINLPGENGELILRKLRRQSEIPVIMITSRNTETDEVISLSNGADDFITKPYNPMILLLHIEAIFKRFDQSVQVIEYNGIKIDLQKGELIGKDKTIVLSKNEMIIFDFLLKNKHRIVSRDDLINRLWDSEEFVDDNTLSVNISRLRTKLIELGLKDVIMTRRGLGYQLK